jgi:hypothetical protein
VEEAIFIANVSELQYLPDRYSRVYFGNEFCQKLIPSEKELEEVLSFILSKSLGFTFVTSFATDTVFEPLRNLFGAISKRAPDSEVVINDWGVLSIVREYNLKPVIGRLLTKQSRDPRILSLIDRLPRKAVERSKAAGIGPYLTRFLKTKAVERMEIDNLPQGIRLGECKKPAGFRFSLYFPFNYVTTSRQCLFDNGCLHSESELSPKCQRKCRHNAIILKHHTMPLPLYMKGNTIFLENRKMPDCLFKEGIDRIIHQPDFPM